MRRLTRKSSTTANKVKKTPIAQSPKSTISKPNDSPYDVDGLKWVVRGGIAGIAATVICSVVFFQSDIPAKIVAAQSLKSMQPQTVLASGPDDGSFTTDARSELSVGEQSTPTGSLSESTSNAGETGDVAVTIDAGTIVDADALAEQLGAISETHFIALAESIDMMIANDPTRVNLPERKSLAEAYAEAESKYPGQIDGSKRLKLVDELNAIDYTYYVAESGDTLLELSRTFAIPLGQLVEINGIHEADEIDAGAILLFPSETVQPE